MTGLLALLLVAVLIVIPAVVVRWTNAAHRRARSHHRALDALGHITSSAPAGRVETTRTTVPFGSTAPPGGKADLDGNPRLATDHLGSQAYVRVVSSDSPAPLPAPRPLTGGWRPTRATGAAPFRRPGIVPETAGFEQPDVLPGQLSGRDGVEHVRAFRGHGETAAHKAPDTDGAEEAADGTAAGRVEVASLDGPAVRVFGPGHGSEDEAETGQVAAVGDGAPEDGSAEDQFADDRIADDEDLEDLEEDGWASDPAVTAEVRILDTGAAPYEAPAWEAPEPVPSEPVPPEPVPSEPEPDLAVPMSRLVIPAFPEEDPTLEHVVVLGRPPDAPTAPPAPGAVAAEGGIAPLTIALPETSGTPVGRGNGSGDGSGNGSGPGEPPTHPVPAVPGDDPSAAASDDTGGTRALETPLVTPSAPPGPETAPTGPRTAPRTGRPTTGPSHRRPMTPGRHRARNMAITAVVVVIVLAAALVANRQLINRHPTASPPLPRTPPASSVTVPRTVHHHRYHHHRPPTTTTAPPTTARPPVALVSNSPGISVYRIVGHAQITLVATGPCWVDVRRPDANGATVFVQTMVAGQSHTVQGPLWLRLGNPTAVTIKVGSITVHPPVKQGSPYDVQFR